MDYRNWIPKNDRLKVQEIMLGDSKPIFGRSSTKLR